MNLLDRKIDEILNMRSYIGTSSSLDNRVKKIPKEIVYHLTNLKDVKTFDPYTEFAKEIGFMTDFEIISGRMPNLGITPFLHNMGLDGDTEYVLDLYWYGNNVRNNDSFALDNFREISTRVMKLGTWLYKEFQNKLFFDNDGFNFKKVLNDVNITNNFIDCAETTAKRYVMGYIVNQDRMKGSWSQNVMLDSSNETLYNKLEEAENKPTSDEINELYRKYVRESL